jgi:hypothetical protein
MSKKTLLMLSATVMFGAALVAPSAALAQFGPPPGPPPALAGPPPGFGAGGPPPGLGAGGPPLGNPPHTPTAGLPPRGPAGEPPRDIPGAPSRFSRLDGAAGLRGLDRGGQANFRGVEARAAAYSASYTRNGYAGYGHGYRYWPYAAAAAYAHSGSYASSDDGCYYVSAYRRNGYRRVLVCREE